MLSVQGYNHHILHVLVHDSLQLRFVSFGWGQGVVATGIVGVVIAASEGNYEQCVWFYYSQSRSLP